MELSSFHRQRGGRPSCAEPLESRTLLSAAAYDSSRILVSFKKPLAAMALPFGTHVSQSLGENGRVKVVQLAAGLSVPQALAQYRANPAVRYAEPDYHVSITGDPNDMYYQDGSLWGMYGDQSTPAADNGSQAAEAWEAGITGTASGASPVYVGVIDQGIDISHPDLAPNIWNNPFDKPGDNIDNDGNGYVDDVHGWDFYHNDNSVYDPGYDQHGTHVAGTIGAVGNNGTGVTGVDWNVKLIATKFLGPDGGYISDAISALDYYTDLKTRHGMNIVAVNNSWGGGGYSQAMQDAIDSAARAGILFIAAAGNGGGDNIGDDNDADPAYPSSYDTTADVGFDSVIGVAAIAYNGNLATFSNYGATSVDLAAPGVNIFSTQPGSAYGYMSGTSMATPHVTGAVALFAAAHPGATAEDIRAAILAGAAAAPLPQLQGMVATGGHLDIAASLAQPVTEYAPLAPSDLTIASVSRTTATLSWTDQSWNEDGFHIVRSDDNGDSWIPLTDVNANTTGYVDTNLTPGSTHIYRVSSYIASPGESDYTNSASATTLINFPAPATPSGLAVTGVTTSSISVHWNDNAVDESGYRLQRSIDGVNWANVALSLPAGTNTYVDNGLNAATAYSYRVIAYRDDLVGVTTTRTYSDFSNIIGGVTEALTGNGTGLRGDYYDNMLTESTTSAGAYTLSGWKFAHTDALVNFNWGTGAPASGTTKLGVDTFVVKWTGLIQPRYTDLYTLRFEGDDGVGAWITINGVQQPLWTPTWDRKDGTSADRTATEYTNASPYESQPLALQAGVKYPIQIVYYDYTGAAAAKLLWRSATYQPQQIVPQTQLYQGPTTLKAVANASSKVTLTWTDNATGETGFKIERSTDGTTWTQIATVGANVTTYANTGLTANKTYYYRVRAYNTSPVFNSAYSAKVSVKTLVATTLSGASTLKAQSFSDSLIERPL